MTANAAERIVVESYLDEHSLETTLNDIVNDVVKIRPADPYLHLAAAIKGSSESANTIAGVVAREISNGRATPALEVEVVTAQGSFAASTSIGPYDADEQRYSGLGMRQAVEFVHRELASRLVGLDVLDQEALDLALNKKHDDDDEPMANTVLAASVACCKAGAKHAGLSLHEHVASLASSSGGGGDSGALLPMPHVSVVNGGKCGGTLIFEDLSVVPVGAASLDEALEAVCEVTRQFPLVCLEKEKQCRADGLFGGYTLSDATPSEALELLQEAMRRAKPDDLNFFKVGLDAGCSTYTVKETLVAPPEPADDPPAEDAPDPPREEETIIRYDFGKFRPVPPPKKATDPPPEPVLSGALDAVKVFVDLVKSFPCIITLEDAFDGEDIEAHTKLKEHFDLELLDDEEEEEDAPPKAKFVPVGGEEDCQMQTAGDFICASARAMEAFDEAKTQNTLVLTLAKSRTVSGGISLAEAAKALGWGLVVAVETSSGETDDAFVASFAVGLRAGQFKTGGLGAHEYLSKYNELLRIATGPDAPPFTAKNFRNTSQDNANGDNDTEEPTGPL